MNTTALERRIVAASLDTDTRRAYVAYCNICTLAANMRDCPRCKFNVGLAASLFAGRTYNKPAEQSPEYYNLLRALHTPPAAEEAVDFSETRDAIEAAETELERQRNWLGYEIGHAEPIRALTDAAYGCADLGSAEWFAGIDPIEF